MIIVLSATTESFPPHRTGVIGHSDACSGRKAVVSVIKYVARYRFPCVTGNLTLAGAPVRLLAARYLWPVPGVLRQLALPLTRQPLFGCWLIRLLSCFVRQMRPLLLHSRFEGGLGWSRQEPGQLRWFLDAT